MTTITIELEDGAGTGTISIDNAEPVPFQSAQEACEVIEQLAGAPDGDEAVAFSEASENADPRAISQPTAKPQMGARGMGGM